MGLNLSDYNRSGIFIDEINNSVTDKPAPQEAVVNFIPGFSKKGTVFNRPVLVKSKTDRTAYFGDIDRYLEKKGSYFHRTIDISLQTAPIWAMNLLKTNSLDLLNYRSLSLSAQYDNDVTLYSQYDNFFNKAGFWQRDTESFLFFARNTERMMHLTNMSDKKITAFAFKSKQVGFDITAETWYGGKDKVPTWMNPYDLISDYMIRVVVVGGDWSNYTTLAADQTWSKYFASSGLRKNKVNDFIRDRAVTLLGDYTGSLIPYFRDLNNNNIFIENLINLNTDKTGLFCAFDIDNVETDFPNGRVDLVGQTLADNTKSKINFLSYYDTIEEIDTYDNMPLDSLGNVIGIGSNGARSTSNSNGIIKDLSMILSNGSTTTPTITITSSGGYAIINNASKDVSTTAITFGALAAPALAGQTNYRIDVLYIDQTGVINLLAGTVIQLTTGLSEANAVLGGLTYPAGLPNNAIVMGYYFRQAINGPSYTTTYVPVAYVNATYIPLTIGGDPSADITVSNTANNILQLTFNGTANVTKANYADWRKVLFFNELVTKHSLADSVIIDINEDKIDLTGWVDNYSSTGSAKTITITVASGIDIKTVPYVNSSSTGGDFVFYYSDNEFLMDPSETTGLETRNTTAGSTNTGIVARKSEMYLDFYNGMINTGDFFYEKKAVTSSLKFVHFANTNYPGAVGDWVIMNAADATALGIGAGANNFHALIQSHPANALDFSIQTGYDYNGSPVSGSPEEGLQADGYLLSGETAFSVNELLTTYVTLQDIDVYDFDAKIYLKMYFIGSTLMVEFKADNTLITPYSSTNITSSSINSSINVYSGESSYEQTLEIETHSTYTISDTKVLIDLVRYPEVKVGDYLKAYIDNSALHLNEYPKKFARIIKKTPWANNATYNVNYAEITTDIKIDVSSFGGDLQTTRYTTIEDYIDTYKAITLTGFAVQAASIPDGTETRQSEILDIVGKDTALYNAIVNKNKFNFRYLIDSFGLGLTEFSKQQLMDITGKRKNCIAILNAPSIKYLKQSSNPSFINVDGTLNLEYLKLGGNPETNPAFLYSFGQGSGKDDGRDTAGYFFPYGTVNDNGRPMIFPPAAFVGNTYMRKIGSSVSGIYNWTVAAGSENGRILGISNVEQDFTEEDLIQMYAMGLNPIMYLKNVGFYIETEFTASTVPLSSLSFLHVREVLIDLENELYAMLFKYQWKFNTPAIRAKIKREADEICQRYVDRSALYAYENLIDETNNTPQLIDNQFGLLETKISVVKAMGILVNIITINATGTLEASSGFAA